MTRRPPLRTAGCGLALLLLAQVRRAERVQRAFAESERRFRLAVEAARCGIWEWDLDADQVFMSDVTGAILGWGGGGVAFGNRYVAYVTGGFTTEMETRCAGLLAEARALLEGALAYGDGKLGAMLEKKSR